jgi:membrane protease YdiL (CAAX protease family)
MIFAGQSENIGAAGLRPEFLFILPDVISVPLFEEILNRYFIMNKLLRKAGPLYQVLISSVLFALFHLPVVNPFTIVLYFFAGVILGCLYKVENYIMPCFLAHSLCNLLVNLS